MDVALLPAVAALALSVYNTVQAKRGPGRAAGRAAREGLRVELAAVNDVLTQIERAVRNAGNLEGLAPALADGSNKVADAGHRVWPEGSAAVSSLTAHLETVRAHVFALEQWAFLKTSSREDLEWKSVNDGERQKVQKAQASLERVTHQESEARAETRAALKAARVAVDAQITKLDRQNLA